MKSTAEWVEYEHPDHGLIRVLFDWRPGVFGLVWKPVQVEFDLFTPVSVRKSLTAELVSDKLDRSIA